MSTLQVSLPALRFLNTSQPAGSLQADLTAAVTAALQQALVETGLVQELSQVAAATDVFLPTGGGAARMCEQLGLQLLGKVPLDPLLGQAAEEGRSVLALSDEAAADGAAVAAVAAADASKRRAAPSAAALQAIVQQIIAGVESNGAANGVH